VLFCHLERQLAQAAKYLFGRQIFRSVPGPCTRHRNVRGSTEVIGRSCYKEGTSRGRYRANSWHVFTCKCMRVGHDDPSDLGILSGKHGRECPLDTGRFDFLNTRTGNICHGPSLREWLLSILIEKCSWLFGRPMDFRMDRKTGATWVKLALCALIATVFMTESCFNRARPRLAISLVLAQGRSRL
jgi:hypothetical protein